MGDYFFQIFVVFSKLVSKYLNFICINSDKSNEFWRNGVKIKDINKVSENLDKFEHMDRAIVLFVYRKKPEFWHVNNFFCTLFIFSLRPLYVDFSVFINDWFSNTPNLARILIMASFRFLKVCPKILSYNWNVYRLLSF